MVLANQKKHKKMTYDRGRFAESWTVFFLRLKGYKILAQRFKTPVGEVDIIAYRAKTLAFIEVKARQSERGALESLTPAMRQRIERAASYFMMVEDNKSLKGKSYTMRFDLVSVMPFSLAHPFFIRHMDNAWCLTS